jgi:hypothetical protein
MSHKTSRLHGIADVSWGVIAASVVALVANACSGSGNGGTGPSTVVGTACTQAAQCYPGIVAATLQGQVTCLTQLQNGYCTHTCNTDADCCAAPGECSPGFKQVCASFESSGQMYCFLSCATSDIAPNAGTTDPNVYCQTWANASFTCRSTGGGSANRKFCGP